jgi:hypothetical protein
MPRRFDIARIVDAPAAEAWSLLVDTQRWPQWGPSIRKVECETRRLRAHSRGRVRTWWGLWLPFEVAGFEDGHAWSWKVAGIPATGHRVEPLGPRRSRVVFELPAIFLPYAVICRRALARIARLLAGRSR